MSRTIHRRLCRGLFSLMTLGGLMVGLGTGCGSHSTSQPDITVPAPAIVSVPASTNAAPITTNAAPLPPTNHIATQTFCAFTGLSDFSRFTLTNAPDGSVLLISPLIKAAIPWNQLIVSWNATAPPGTFIKVEARVVFPDHTSHFYSLGTWSPDNLTLKRTSVPDQQDEDARVDTDTLVLSHLAYYVQLRLTVGGGKNGASPKLKFLGLSFADADLPPLPHDPNKKAWGKSVAVPQSSQHGYPDENGWCSPAAVSMVMAGWSISEMRPDLLHDVPFVANKVYDDAYGGTGNWPFNTAFAGSYPGMRAYVTRFDDFSEVEDWIAAGIPVIMSTRWDWLVPGRPPDSEGHLLVCVGIAADGDIIVNDPSAHLDRGDQVQVVYKRANVIRAWSKSHHAVYLIYPETAKIPNNNYGHWETR